MAIYRVAFAELHSQYYEVEADNEDQAFQRASMYDDSQEWAIDTWDEGVESQEHAFTEEC